MQDIVSESFTPIEKHPGCVGAATAIMGNKWTPLLVLELARGTARFSELERNLPGLSPRTLSQRLDELEANRIITKTSYAEVPPRVEYALTDKGRDLLPILKSMADWGEKHCGPNQSSSDNSKMLY